MPNFHKIRWKGGTEKPLDCGANGRIQVTRNQFNSYNTSTSLALELNECHYVMLFFTLSKMIILVGQQEMRQNSPRYRGIEQQQQQQLPGQPGSTSTRLSNHQQEMMEVCVTQTSLQITTTIDLSTLNFFTGKTLGIADFIDRMPVLTCTRQCQSTGGCTVNDKRPS